MTTYKLHYFPESGNSYKLALMLTLSGYAFEPIWTDFGGGVQTSRFPPGNQGLSRPCGWHTSARASAKPAYRSDAPWRMKSRNGWYG